VIKSHPNKLIVLRGTNDLQALMRKEILARCPA
jgi:hypothetical protein